MSTKTPIRVLAVEDSSLFRKVLTGLLGRESEIELVGCATDPYDARDQMLSQEIDVMTLDLELPRMAGLTFLRLVMERKPMPVIVLSGFAPMGSQKAIEALIAGAFSVMEKPDRNLSLKEFSEKLIAEIKHAAAAPLRRRRPFLLNRYLPPPAIPAQLFDPRKIIALGASTGGTQALEQVLMHLPANLPGIVVVQHIPAGFSASFAERLNKSCAMEVREARDGDFVRPGLALIAPGDRHMEVRSVRERYQIALHSGAPVEHQRPSVDVLFKSLAQCAGPHTVAVLLTGMGRDGAAGMKELHDLHANTLVQNATSSVVYGMARKAVELDAVDSILPLENIALEIVKALDKRSNPLTSTTYVHR
jgi:two-component system, chemotaxis family, protein-glutamate methylesterase/glutaminase